jgi:hypothetical protein
MQRCFVKIDVMAVTLHRAAINQNGAVVTDPVSSDLISMGLLNQNREHMCQASKR